MTPPAAEGHGRTADTVDRRRAPPAWTRWLAGALLPGALVAALTHRAEERESARLVGDAERLWQLGPAGLHVVGYACAAAFRQRALARRTG